MISGYSSLKYIDLSGIIMRQEECIKLRELIMKNRTIEYLDISNCQIQGKNMSIVLDVLMTNQSLQTLKMQKNSFVSPDNLLSSKLGRLLQGHPRLLHVDVSKCDLKRADIIFVCWSMRDSPNLLSIHLSGNFIGHHDRILIQALLAAKVRWPTPPPNV